MFFPPCLSIPILCIIMCAACFLSAYAPLCSMSIEHRHGAPHVHPAAVPGCHSPNAVRRFRKMQRTKFANIYYSAKQEKFNLFSCIVVSCILFHLFFHEVYDFPQKSLFFPPFLHPTASLMKIIIRITPIFSCIYTQTVSACGGQIIFWSQCP